MGEIVFQLPMKSEEVCLKGLLFFRKGKRRKGFDNAGGVPGDLELDETLFIKIFDF